MLGTARGCSGETIKGAHRPGCRFTSRFPSHQDLLPPKHPIMSYLSFDGTIQEVPLVETNPDHEWRPIIVKARKLGGKRGKAVRALNMLYEFMTLFDPEDDAPFDEVSVSHWGIQVGNYMWELHTDQKMANCLSIQRMTGYQIWDADVDEATVGITDLTDKQINNAGGSSLVWSRGGERTDVGSVGYVFRDEVEE